MKVAPFLLRLMHRFPLSRSMRIGPEDRLGIEIADACRAWTLEGRLRAVWWHSAAEAGVGKDRAVAQARMALAKALGLIPGTPDLVFIGTLTFHVDVTPTPPGHHEVLLIELKAPKGVMSPNQRDFQAWADSLAIRYRVIRTFEEAEAELIRTGMLQPKEKTT